MTSVANIFAPTEKQAAFFRALATSPHFTADEQAAHLAWFRRHGTRHTVMDQIDWLRNTIRDRSARYSQDWFGDAPLSPAEQERSEQVDAVRSAAYGDLMPGGEG